VATCTNRGIPILLGWLTLIVFKVVLSAQGYL
jgi:hypothetical protein